MRCARAQRMYPAEDQHRQQADCEQRQPDAPLFVDQQPEHAYEQARRSGEPLAVFHASRRRARAACAYQAAELASLPADEAAARENDHQGANHYSPAHL